MCDRAHFAALEARLDQTEDRLIRVETDLAGTRKVVEDGFADVKTQLGQIYAEKARWAEWSRNALAAIGRWGGRWGGIIILAALGLSSTPAIIKAIADNLINKQT